MEAMARTLDEHLGRMTEENRKAIDDMKAEIKHEMATTAKIPESPRRERFETAYTNGKWRRHEDDYQNSRQPPQNSSPTTYHQSQSICNAQSSFRASEHARTLVEKALRNRFNEDIFNGSCNENWQCHLVTALASAQKST